MSRISVALLMTGALAFAGSPGRAEQGREPKDSRSGEDAWVRDWHAGLNLRTDIGTHPVRIDGGMRFRKVDFVLVLDPMYFLDRQHDLDAIVHWEFVDGWTTYLGWRPTAIAILDGYQWQEKSLHGISARLPTLAGGHLRGRWGLELAVLWAKHGGGLPTQTLSMASARDWLDHFSFGMFVSFDYASPF